MTVYLCKTKKLAEQFLQECAKEGIIWGNGKSATSMTRWDVYREETCYCVKNGVLSFSDRQYFMQHKYSVAEYAGFIAKTEQELENEIDKLKAELEHLKKERDEWKERAQRMQKEALEQKRCTIESKRREETLHNQLNCAMDMLSEMQHVKKTLEILYMSGNITTEVLKDAVQRAKNEIEVEE